MNEAFDISNLFFLVLAGVIFWRLRGVLGRRTGNERKPYDPYKPSQNGEGPVAHNENDGNVIPLPNRNQPEVYSPEADVTTIDDEIFDAIAPADSELGKNLRKIAKKDPGFHPTEFLDGAKFAYEMIVMAFASGDRNSLESLLSKEVFAGFEQAIDEREDRGDIMESSFIGIEKANIIEAKLQGKKTRLTVNFLSELISSTKNAKGKLIEGDPKKVTEVTDIWTFEREITANDPNWKLVSTESAN